MKKFIFVLIALFLQTSAQANECTARVWLDDSLSPTLTRKVEKGLKHKGYKMLSYQDAVFEDYRFVFSSYSDFVRFYIQIFDAPNFKEIFRVEAPSTPQTHDQTIMNLVANVSECVRD